MGSVPPPLLSPNLLDAGFQSQIEGESVDEFVHSQTTRKKEKYQADLDELNYEDRKIERFVCNGEKNRFTNIACFDEVFDEKNKDFYVHANSFKTPYGNFLISQAPKENTCADHLHLMWLYNVRTVVCLVPAEQAGGYFMLKEGEQYTAFQRYAMKTMAVFDEKQGVTVYQCELRSYKAVEHADRRVVYIICCDVPMAGLRSPRQQSVIMEYMWTFEQTEAMLAGANYTTTVLVHGLSGTRRCVSFAVSAVMCRQILETGQFSAMVTWIEMRKRRAHACSRRHDFYSSIQTVFQFCAQCCAAEEDEESFKGSMEILKSMCEKKANNKDEKEKEEESEPV